MDPKANIKRQLEIAGEIQQITDSADWDTRLGEYEAGGKLADLAEELAELVLALDEWRRKGGFDPYGGA